jgi:hypothetical protein
MVRWVVLTAALAVLAGSASAGTRDGRFGVEYTGRTTCEAFLKAQAARSADYGRYLGFVEGYLTAANRYEPNTFDVAPWQDPRAFGLMLMNHCRRDPKEMLLAAAQKMVVALLPRRLTEFSPLYEVGHGQVRVEVYEAVLRNVQTELAKKGHYAGKVDGKYSTELRSALEAYQTSARLTPTGVPDQPTLWLLLSP